MGKRIESPITREEYNELDRLAKRANQRLASMKEGQREAVNYWTKGKTFSRTMPRSEAEYKQRLEEVKRFLEAKQTTRTGWEEIKRTAVENAGETLRSERKYDLTDKELANIFKEIDKKSQKQFYRILDLVQAKKYRAQAAGKDFNNEELQKAVNQAVRSHIGAGEAIKQKTAARNRAINAGVLRK